MFQISKNDIKKEVNSRDEMAVICLIYFHFRSKNLLPCDDSTMMMERDEPRFFIKKTSTDPRELQWYLWNLKRNELV